MPKYVIYGRPGCQWCEKAIKLLVARGATIEYVNIRANDENMARFRKYYPNTTSVPQIEYWVGDKDVFIIGGYIDLEQWFGLGPTEGSDI